jgi:succinate dehydrogenase hydrophobic anchor subunit
MTTDQRAVERPAAAPRGIPAFVGQVLSGVALLVLLTLHMIAQHFVVPTGLRYYDDVIDWLRSPIVLAVEVLFLSFVTYHALLGVRAVLFDFGFSEKTEKRITGIFVVIGIATVAYGVALLAAIINAAP